MCICLTLLPFHWFLLARLDVYCNFSVLYCSCMCFSCYPVDFFPSLLICNVISLTAIGVSLIFVCISLIVIRICFICIASLLVLIAISLMFIVILLISIAIPLCFNSIPYLKNVLFALRRTLSRTSSTERYLIATWTIS